MTIKWEINIKTFKAGSMLKTKYIWILRKISRKKKIKLCKSNKKTVLLLNCVALLKLKEPTKR